jgi:hypothetical protein
LKKITAKRPREPADASKANPKNQPTAFGFLFLDGLRKVGSGKDLAFWDSQVRRFAKFFVVEKSIVFQRLGFLPRAHQRPLAFWAIDFLPSLIDPQLKNEPAMRASDVNARHGEAPGPAVDACYRSSNLNERFCSCQAISKILKNAK